MPRKVLSWHLGILILILPDKVLTPQVYNSETVLAEAASIISCGRDRLAGLAAQHTSGLCSPTGAESADWAGTLCALGEAGGIWFWILLLRCAEPRRSLA